MKTDVRIRVRYEFKIPGEEETKSGIEEEGSWFLLDQQGNMWSYGPLKPVRPVEDGVYSELEPLFKIGEEYLSVKEIEKRLSIRASRDEVFKKNTGDKNKVFQQIKKQREELNKQKVNEIKITCVCGKKVAVTSASKCFYCGIYFCADCSRMHYESGEHIMKGAW